MLPVARLLLLFLCVVRLSRAQTPAKAIEWGFGTAVGQLSFTNGSRESALGVTIAAHVWDWLDISVNPTYAWAESPSVQVGPLVQPARRVSGLTDLPLNLWASHELPGAWSPSIGFSLGITLPTGDTATLGSGQLGLGAGIDVAFSPTDQFAFDVGAERSLSNGYSTGLAASAATSLALSGRIKSGAVSYGLSISGDVGAVPSGFENARSVAAGVGIPLDGGMSVNVAASAGLTAGSPAWAFSVGVGTTPSGVAAASIAPYQMLRHAFGGGRKLTTKPKTKGP